MCVESFTCVPSPSRDDQWLPDRVWQCCCAGEVTFHMSVTVPCDASNSLMIDPSSFTPFSTDVKKPGERCT